MNRLKEIRNENSLTLMDLSEKLNIPKSTLSRYENGTSEPKQETWEQIADFFDVSVGYLMGVTQLEFNFSQAEDVETINKLTKKIVNQSTKQDADLIVEILATVFETLESNSKNKKEYLNILINLQSIFDKTLLRTPSIKVGKVDIDSIPIPLEKSVSEYTEIIKNIELETTKVFLSNLKNN